MMMELSDLVEMVGDMEDWDLFNFWVVFWMVFCGMLSLSSLEASSTGGNQNSLFCGFWGCCVVVVSLLADELGFV